MAVVLRLPAFDIERRVLTDRLRREALLDRGQIDERLERRAGLAPGGHRAVILALGVVAPPDHGAYGPIRGHRHQRALAGIELDAFCPGLVVHGGFGSALP